MKDQEWYKKLWRDKLQQLPVEGDEQAMWQKMQSLLDEQLPVNPPSNPGKPGKFPGDGAIVSVLVIISAIVALLYFNGAFKGRSGNGNHTSRMAKDSILHADSARTIEPQTANEDSIVKAGINIKLDKHSIPTTDSATQTRAISGNKNLAAANAVYNNAVSQATPATKPGALSGSINHMQTNHVALTPNGRNNGANTHSKKQGIVAGNYSGYSFYLQKNGAIHHGHIGVGVSGHNNPGSGSNGKNAGQKQKGVSTFTSKNHPSVADVLDNSDTIRQQKAADSVFNQLVSGRMIAGNNITPNTISATDINTDDQVQVTPGNAVNKNQVRDKNSMDKSRPSCPAKNKSGKASLSNSAFSFDVKLGMNTGQGSSVYGGIAAGYNFTPRISLAIGADIMPSRTISGSYNSKTQLTYRVDTGKYGVRQSGQIIISGTRKISTVDVPVTVSYRINRYLSVYGGPVISLPVKANATSPTLTKLANSNDTTKSLVAPYVSSTVIDSKLGFDVTGGLKLNFNRLFINVGYMQALQPYTISSGLGSSSVKYHTVQLGIGLQLFKPKGKKAFTP